MSRLENICNAETLEEVHLKRISRTITAYNLLALK